MDPQLQAVEGELNAVVREYLLAANYQETAGTFDQECGARSLPPAITLPRERRESAKTAKIKAELLCCMDEGDCDQFFSLWHQHLPPPILSDDTTCVRLEFYLHMYFAIQGLHSHAPKPAAPTPVGECMSRFRHYLESRGTRLCAAAEFLPFYALPFVPEPEKHPSFQQVFTAQWIIDLRVRVERFLSSALIASPLPRLLFLMKRDSSANGDGGYAAALEQQIAECEDREMGYIDRHTTLQREHHALVGIAAELVEALEMTIRGQGVTPAYIQSVCSRLASFSAPPLQSLSLAPGTLSNMVHEHREEPPLPPLDFEAVRRDLSSLTERNCALLLQALRWRLARSQPGSQRAGVVGDYKEGDVLGLHPPHKSALPLLCSSSEMVREQIAFFCNSLASMATGRAYLMAAPECMSALVQALKTEPKDLASRQHVLGCLQKLSLRRPAQTYLIRSDLIDWALEQLSSLDSLSDYSQEYCVALLMNLCLRTLGKAKCAARAAHVIGVLSNLLSHESAQIRTYIHGTLYSLLSHPAILRAARATGLEAVLSAQMAVSDPPLRRQLEYILKQLATHGSPPLKTAESGDEQEEDDDEEDLLSDGAERESLIGLGPSGEQLLASEYLSTTAPPPMPTTTRPATGRVRADPLLDMRPVTPHKPPSARARTAGGPRLSKSRPATAAVAVEENESAPLPPPPVVRPAPPSDKAIKAMGEKDANLDEYYGAFATRGKVPRTPLKEQR